MFLTGRKAGVFCAVGVAVSGLLAVFFVLVSNHQQTPPTSSHGRQDIFSPLVVGGLPKAQDIAASAEYAGSGSDSEQRADGAAGNSREPQYYNSAAAAQFLAGDRDEAIATLKRGLAASPDSDLLRSRLDILTKEEFSDSNIEAVRE